MNMQYYIVMCEMMHTNGCFCVHPVIIVQDLESVKKFIEDSKEVYKNRNDLRFWYDEINLTEKLAYEILPVTRMTMNKSFKVLEKEQFQEIVIKDTDFQ